MPILLTAGARAGDPQALAERVGHCQSIDMRQGPRRQAERNQKPIVGIDQRKFHQQKLRHVGRRWLHRAEIGLAILERPPARIGHTLKRDRRRK